MANKDEKKSGNTLVHDTIALTVITLIAGDMEKELPLMSKKEAAGCILDTILERM